MPYRCEKCQRKWDDQLAVENDFRCTRKCGGVLVPLEAETAIIPLNTLNELLVHLPSVLAIPLQGYTVQTHPVMRLHRLCDVAEIITRFCTILALGEMRGRLGDHPLQERLRKQLPHIERPTFGDWRKMLAAIVTELGPGAGVVCGELPEFVTQQLVPGLSEEPHFPETNLIELRNRAVHGGPMIGSTAQEFLALWEPWLEQTTAGLGFLKDCDVCQYEDGTARKLVGAAPTAEAIARAATLMQALENAKLNDRVLLVRQSRWVDLWPLCDYGRARTTSLQGVRHASAECPLIYIRAERDRLLYAALGVDISHGERTDVLAEFRT